MAGDNFSSVRNLSARMKHIDVITDVLSNPSEKTNVQGIKPGRSSADKPGTGNLFNTKV